MTETRNPHLPIGYWLKRADALLTKRIDEAQAANKLNRTEWQILNVLHEVGAATAHELALPMRPFADAPTLAGTLNGLHERGLLAGGEIYTLTAEGRQLHAAALALQQEVRLQAVHSIEEADYLTAVRVLQQIVANLDDEQGS